ncbi:response regulator [uncultured Alistipes sp.]|nr:response regulator [uncultured Alistipes sp.]
MNVLIVEDELMARKNLERLIGEQFSDLQIVGRVGTVRDAVAWLRTPANRADVVFMDAELSDGTCVDIFRQTEIAARVIMTTAYDNYAVRAFEVNCID